MYTRRASVLGPLVVFTALFACAQMPGDQSAVDSSDGKALTAQQAARPSLGIDDSASIVMRSPTIAEALHDVSGPLTLTPPAPRGVHVEHEVRRLPRPTSAAVTAGAVQTGAPALLMPATAKNFDAQGNGFSGPGGTFTFAGTPPDTNGDVGPNHYVQTVNTDIAIFDKSGKPLFGPVPVNTIFHGLGGGCETNNDGDPVVLYDPIADRWVVSQFSVNTTPYLECVAVSATADPTGSWNRYAFDYGSTDFPDYPKMGVWPDAYYETFNIFAGGSSFAGPRICAYDRAKMLAGQAATQQCFDVKNQNLGGVLPADLDGARQPPAGAPNYLLALGETATTLAFWKFHVDWTTPSNSSLTGPTNITVASYAPICTATSGDCVPQPGVSDKLQGLDDRLMFRLAYRNFGDHESLVATHAVAANSGSGIRWYELRVAGQTPSLFQSGTFAPDSSFRWLGSAAQDQSGNMAMGFSVSSASIKPSIHYAGRLASDAAGSMPQGESSVVAGGGSQQDNSGAGRDRWGDYASMSVDPSDDCTFWFTSEYLKATGGFNTWSTRVASFKFPGCGGSTGSSFSITPNPASASVAQGASATISVATAVTSGSAQSVSFSIAGLPQGATGTFNPASITAGASSTLTLSTGSNTPVGTYPLTISGTGSSSSATASVSLTVTAGAKPDFTLTAAPASQSVTAGQTTAFTATETPVNGFTGTVALSVTGLPSGATGTFSGNAASGATLAIATATSTSAGTYPLTITGISGSLTHTASVSLTVNAAATPDFSLALAQSSASVTAGTTASASVSISALNGFSASVALAAAGLPSGVTASFSPSSVSGSGSATLTFTASASAPAGSSAVTVTGSSGLVSHSAQLTLTVVAAQNPDFSLSVSPVSLTVTAGASGSSVATVSAQGGFTGSVALSASAPAGVTVSFGNSPISGSGTSSIGVAVGASVAAGSYSITVAGTSGSLSHSAQLSLTVKAASTGGVAFFDDAEHGNIGWTTYTDNPSGPLWSIETTTAAYSGTHRWRSNAGGNYANNASNFLISPAFSLEGATTATLKFIYKFHTEQYYDYFYVWATADEGKTWTQLGYGTGASRGWNQWAPQASIDMSKFAGKAKVRIAFSIQSDYSVTDFGAALDDIQVTTGGAAGAAATAALDSGLD